MRPTKDAAPEITWFPSKDTGSIKDLTLSSDWGTGQHVYLYFAVKDTGRGLSEDEKNRLFHRFSQANPRTHVRTSTSINTEAADCSRYNMEGMDWDFSFLEN